MFWNIAKISTPEIVCDVSIQRNRAEYYHDPDSYLYSLSGPPYKYHKNGPLERWVYLLEMNLHHQFTFTKHTSQ